MPIILLTSIIIGSTVAGLTAAVSAIKCARYTRDLIPEPSETRPLLGHHDSISDPMDAEEDLSNAAQNLEAIPRIAGVLARQARLQFYNPEFSEANVLVIHKFLKDEAVRRNIRHADMARIMPFAMKLSFIKTRNELLADQIESSILFNDRDRLNEADWWQWIPVMDRLLGSRTGRRRPSRA